MAQERAPPGNMLIPGNTTIETTPCSIHGVPERRSNDGGGWGGVTPCVVSPPHSLPTKCATFAAKYDRLLTSWGCCDERHHWPVRMDKFPLFMRALCGHEDMIFPCVMAAFRYILKRLQSNTETQINDIVTEK